VVAGLILQWSALNIWPLVKRSIAHARSMLSSCSERTVNYHLANAMSKLKVDNEMAAIQRACWLGAI
jgi:LuxR family transcriptional regulator, quorum-sensing system regulator SolR